MIKLILFLLILTSIVFIVYKKISKTKNFMLIVGEKSPDFSLLNQDKKIIKLSDYKGKNVMVYFYPKDETPGCTKEACGLRDESGEFKDNGIEILGISYDAPESHKKFQENHKLPFNLLSDSNHEVSKKYGAYQGLMKNLFAKRMTFLINKDGKIIYIFENVDPLNHAKDVLQKFKKLS